MNPQIPFSSAIAAQFESLVVYGGSGIGMLLACLFSLDSRAKTALRGSSQEAANGVFRLSFGAYPPVFSNHPVCLRP